jgi:competence protein ComEA
MKFFEEILKEKISSFWQNFRAEIILIGISLVIVIISLAIFIKANNQNGEEQIFFEETSNNQTSNFPALPAGRKLPTSNKIYIDLSGAVEKPDVYEATSGARLRDILILGNGLSAKADRQFFARNFNLARILTDEEKIYIPSQEEIAQGLFKQNALAINQIQPGQNSRPTEQGNQIEKQQLLKININTASVADLDTLPGVGQITAQKIINNRPYKLSEELLTRKVVNKGVYEKIKDLVSP